MPGNATYQELDGVPDWQLYRSLASRLGLSMLQFAIARMSGWTIPQMQLFRRNRRELLRATLVAAGKMTVPSPEAVRTHWTLPDSSAERSDH